MFESREKRVTIRCCLNISHDDAITTIHHLLIDITTTRNRNLIDTKRRRQLIRFYGDSLQAFVPGYLDMSMEGFTKNQGAMRDRIAEALGGGNQMVENLTRQNLQMFENAMAMFSPFGTAAAKGGESKSAAKQPEDIADLKEEMEAMRHQLAELSQRK